MNRALRSALSLTAALLAMPLATGCGDEADPPPSFILRVNSTDVELSSVGLLRIRITPDGTGGFVDDPAFLGDGFREGLSSRLDGRTLVIEANAGYVERNARMLPGSLALFTVDVPVWSPEPDAARVGSGVQVGFLCDTEEIGALEVEGRLTLPVPRAETMNLATYQVRCKTTPGPGGPTPLPQCSIPCGGS